MGQCWEGHSDTVVTADDCKDSEPATARYVMGERKENMGKKQDGVGK